MSAWTDGDTGAGCTLAIALLFLGLALPIAFLLRVRHTMKQRGTR